MLTRIEIARHERGFLYEGVNYTRFLRPGVHWVWGLRVGVTKASTRAVEPIDLDDLDVYLRDPEVAADLVVADLSGDERAIVWIDGRVATVLGPGRHAFWSDIHEVKLEIHSTAALRLEHPQLDAILAVAGARAQLSELTVPAGSRGMLFVDQELADELAPGRYAYWTGAARITLRTVELREVEVDVAGQEILTADRVSLRINLAAGYRVVDARRSVEAAVNVTTALYRELQLALREAIGTRKLDELLAAKETVGQQIAATVAPRAKALGLELGPVGLKDVILPGEMKVLLNQVVEAEKRAQANLILRREETAATRSLLNTAKLIEASPTLLRLKELEAAERIAASIDSIQVIGGGLEGLLKQILPPPSPQT